MTDDTPMDRQLTEREWVATHAHTGGIRPAVGARITSPSRFRHALGLPTRWHALRSYVRTWHAAALAAVLCLIGAAFCAGYVLGQGHGAQQANADLDRQAAEFRRLYENRPTRPEEMGP